MKDEKDLGATPRRSIEAGQVVHAPQLSHVAHTAGPWTVSGEGPTSTSLRPSWSIDAESWQELAVVFGNKDEESVTQEGKANACLIAAAPEMYEALKHIRDQTYLDAEGPELRAQNEGNHCIAAAAIAKAEGRQVGCVSDSAPGHSDDSRAQR